MDQQKALLQGLWRKAQKQGTPLEIPCKTQANATRMRFALYNAVRGVRAGKEGVDDLLQEAIDNCTVGFGKEDRSIVVIQHKIMTDLMQVVTSIMQDEDQIVKVSADILIEESQELLLKKLQEEDPHVRATPYYTR